VELAAARLRGEDPTVPEPAEVVHGS
jgi:hypothetical protein